MPFSALKTEKTPRNLCRRCFLVLFVKVKGKTTRKAIFGAQKRKSAKLSKALRLDPFEKRSPKKAPNENGTRGAAAGSEGSDEGRAAVARRPQPFGRERGSGRFWLANRHVFWARVIFSASVRLPLPAPRRRKSCRNRRASRGRGLGLKSSRFFLGREKRRIENCCFFGFGQKSRLRAK